MDPIAPFINRAMADILVSAYKEERMTQADLVERTDINATTMQRILAGKSKIDVVQLADIADALGVPPQDLMERAVERAERLSAAASTTDDLATKRKQLEAMEPSQIENRSDLVRAAENNPEERVDLEPDPA